MRLGVVSFLWAVPFTEADLPLLERVKTWGYDVFEFPAGSVEPARMRKALEAAELEPVVMATASGDADVSSDDGDERAAGQRFLADAVTYADLVGAKIVMGHMHRGLGRLEGGSPARRKVRLGRAAEALRDVGQQAATVGIDLAIEPSNRFQSDLTTTVQEGLELCDLVGLDNVGLGPDVFHMAIEERDLAQALRVGGPRIKHLHVCEPDRGTPGTGRAPWDEIRDALGAIAYDGIVTYESWAGDLEPGWCMWRPYFADPDESARDALTFLRNRFPAATTPATEEAAGA